MLGDRKRVAFTIEVDLDPSPGVLSTMASAQLAILGILQNTIWDYNPTVSSIPEKQTEAEKAQEAYERDTKELVELEVLLAKKRELYDSRYIKNRVMEALEKDVVVDAKSSRKLMSGNLNDVRVWLRARLTERQFERITTEDILSNYSVLVGAIGEYVSASEYLNQGFKESEKKIPPENSPVNVVDVVNAMATPNVCEFKNNSCEGEPKVYKVRRKFGKGDEYKFWMCDKHAKVARRS